jgi:hypothetical protein
MGTEFGFEQIGQLGGVPADGLKARISEQV